MYHNINNRSNHFFEFTENDNLFAKYPAFLEKIYEKLFVQADNYSIFC